MVTKKKMKKKTVVKVKRDQAITDDAVFRKNDRVVFREDIEGEVMLVCLDDLDTYFKIEGAASEQWQQIDGRRSFQSIVKLSANTHDQDLSMIQKESKKFFTDLLSAKLISRVK